MYESYLIDNCLDWQVERHPDRVAFIWDKDEPDTQENITYKLVKVINGLAEANIVILTLWEHTAWFT